MAEAGKGAGSHSWRLSMCFWLRDVREIFSTGELAAAVVVGGRAAGGPDGGATGWFVQCVAQASRAGRGKGHSVIGPRALENGLTCEKRSSVSVMACHTGVPSRLLWYARLGVGRAPF